SCNLSAALFPRAHGMGHHIDLGIYRVGTPDNHQIGLRHLAGIDASDATDSCGIARVSRIDADRRVKSGILFHVAQAIDAIAHHQAHCSGVIIGPDAFRAEPALGFNELFSHEIERIIPRYALELSRTFCTGPAQRVQQALGMMFPFGVARDLGADHARCVVVVFCAVHAPDRALVENFDVQRTGRWAIVRARRMPDPHGLWETDRLIHRALTIADWGERAKFRFGPEAWIAARGLRPAAPAQHPLRLHRFQPCALSLLHTGWSASSRSPDRSR